MHLVYAFLADAAQYTPDGKLSMLGGDFNSITAVEFPHTHPVIAVVMRFSLTREEAVVAHPVRIQLRQGTGLEGMLIAQIDGAFPAIESLPEPGEPLLLANVAYLLMSVFPTAGNYTVIVAADERLVKEFPLSIALRPVGFQESGEG